MRPPQRDPLAPHGEEQLGQMVGSTGRVTGTACEAVGVLGDQDAAAVLGGQGHCKTLRPLQAGPRLPE
jgi:hypothetical protein